MNLVSKLVAWSGLVRCAVGWHRWTTAWHWERYGWCQTDFDAVERIECSRCGKRKERKK